MAKIVTYKDISLDALTISKGQVRVHDVARDIDILAESIEVQGLLQPIVVCPARQEGKWEILTGQRRFLAHKKLGRMKISAAVLDERVEEGEAKAISITENLIRRKLSGKDLKDGILYLYNIYGSVKDVCEATGLPRDQVNNYVKYPRLLPELKPLVDDQSIDINAAVKAQDASVDDHGIPNPEVAVKLAQEMASMSNAQRKRLVQERKLAPEKPIDDIIEEAKSSAKVIQIVATVTQDTHRAIQRYAREENTTQDAATVTLIEEALTSHGLLEGLS